MADYSSYLPVTPGLETFAGISPEEAAQIGQYKTPDISGRTHPMGGLALAGAARREGALDQYLKSLQAGNVWRQQQMERAIQANLTEAATNQIGRFGPELLRQGDLRLLAGSPFGQIMMPNLQDQSGQPTDTAVEADTNARLFKQGEDMKNVAQAGLANVQAGFQPNLPQFAQRWGLPLTKSVPLSVQVAELHRRGMAAGAGGKPIKTGQTQYLDTNPASPTYGQMVTRYTFAGGAGGGVNTSASAATLPATSPAATSTGSGTPPGWTPMQNEELSDEQMAHAQSRAVEATNEGYQPVGFFTNDMGETVLLAQNASGQQLSLNLDEAGNPGGGGDTGDGTSD